MDGVTGVLWLDREHITTQDPAPKSLQPLSPSYLREDVRVKGKGFILCSAVHVDDAT